ncbi:ClpXP protease specificity-enhancing factor [Pseudohaliea sp.]|uniref:ClpXP protease specificity-enhancing factor n=1 Tax=Pseudohaliea sp. TaxID=2740289 RepID=UPI0032F03215
MNSSRPYILRALYDWIVDNDCTPHILVDAMQPGVEVPSEYVKDGQIVLNVSPTAVIDLHLSNHLVTFNGRFGGRPMDVAFPVTAVLGIYARENGQGMVFEPDEPPEPPEGGPPPADGPGGDERRSAGRPSLKVVK